MCLLRSSLMHCMTRGTAFRARGFSSYCRGSNFFPRWYLKDSNELETVVREDGFITHNKLIKHKLLRQYAPGVFCFSPLLTRSLEKLHRVIDREMTAIGAQKMLLPTLGAREDWDRTGRWEAMGGELLRLQDRQGRHYCLSPTHEEAVTRYYAAELTPESSLPVMLYQISTKFRDEMRPKHGLLRCREFQMKDLYCFDSCEATARETYERVTGAYRAIFARLGLNVLHVSASSGAMGGSFSHEFQVRSPVGEDRLMVCSECGKALNEELVLDGEVMPCDREDKCCHMQPCSAVEVAHTFLLGERYSEALGAHYTPAQQGLPKQLCYMGCYGIGVTRLLAVALDASSPGNHRDLRWPEPIAPFQVAVLTNSKWSAEGVHVSEQLSRHAHLRGEVVLFDDVADMRKQVFMIRTLQSVGVPHIINVTTGSMKNDPSRYRYFDTARGGSESLLTLSEIQGLLSALDTEPL